jgi:hypothetical protein
MSLIIVIGISMTYIIHYFTFFTIPGKNVGEDAFAGWEGNQAGILETIPQEGFDQIVLETLIASNIR